VKNRDPSDFKIKKSNRMKKKESKKRDFSSGILEYYCQDCQKSYLGWAEQDICPDCGGNLVLVEKS